MGDILQNNSREANHFLLCEKLHQLKSASETTIFQYLGKMMLTSFSFQELSQSLQKTYIWKINCRNNQYVFHFLRIIIKYRSNKIVINMYHSYLMSVNEIEIVR
jgi:hypothetical protein